MSASAPSTSPGSLPRVTPAELRETLLAAEKKVVVVDVRDEVSSRDENWRATFPREAFPHTSNETDRPTSKTRKKNRQSERTHVIKDALHAPAYGLRAEGPEGDAALDAVLEKAAAKGASEVVVHCALSKVRGPACAARLADRVKQTQGTAAQPSIKISVLHGGFDAWHEEVGPRHELTEEPGK